MLIPKRYENGVAIFSKTSIDLFGFPEEYGYQGRYQVIDDDQPQYATEYQQENEVQPPKRKHLYCRFTRFRLLVNRLLGIGPARSRQYYDCLEKLTEHPDFESAPLGDIWRISHKILSKARLSKYYTFIPTFAQESNTVDISIIDKELVQRVLCNFMKMHLAYGYNGGISGRKYFPNLRYIAVRLLQNEGYSNPLGISGIKTKSRRERLEQDFRELYEKAMQLDSVFLLEHFANINVDCL